MAQWFWRRFLNFVNAFSPFCNYLPLKKSRVLHLNKFESPSTKDALCQLWLKLVQWFWRRRWKCEKFTTTTTTTDKFWSEKLTWAFCSDELTKTSLNFVEGIIIRFMTIGELWRSYCTINYCEMRHLFLKKVSSKYWYL